MQTKNLKAPKLKSEIKNNKINTNKLFCEKMSASVRNVNATLCDTAYCR